MSIGIGDKVTLRRCAAMVLVPLGSTGTVVAGPDTGREGTYTVSFYVTTHPVSGDPLPETRALSVTQDCVPGDVLEYVREGSVYVDETYDPNEEDDESDDEDDDTDENSVTNAKVVYDDLPVPPLHLLETHLSATTFEHVVQVIKLDTLGELCRRLSQPNAPRPHETLTWKLQDVLRYVQQADPVADDATA